MSASLRGARKACQMVDSFSASCPHKTLRPAAPLRFTAMCERSASDQLPFKCFYENRRTIRASYGHDVCEGRKALNGSGPPEAKGG
jgi:hypothetical protein